MRGLIGDIYKLLFRLSGNRPFSFVFALFYVSVLNLVIIYGISQLLEGWWMSISLFVKMFAFPYSVLMVLLMMLLNFLTMLPLRYLLRDARRHASVIPVLVYTCATLLILLYFHYV
jgi:hypothetical protein